jgi:hypothetical protein
MAEPHRRKRPGADAPYQPIPPNGVHRQPFSPAGYLPTNIESYLLRPPAATYVHVASLRSAQVATKADPQEST